jgi:hypothetical protein
LRGFRQFDAPVCVIITYDRVLDGSDDAPFAGPWRPPWSMPPSLAGWAPVREQMGPLLRAGVGVPHRAIRGDGSPPRVD